MKIKLILLMCFLVCLSCSKAGDMQSSEDEDDQTEQNVYDGTNNSVWFVRLKLKPQADASYLVTEDPVIKALLLKHYAKITQSWRWSVSDPELLLYYDLTGIYNTDRTINNRDNCIRDLLSTGKFEDEAVYEYSSTLEVDWVVKLKIKPQADENYRATNDPVIMAVVFKHNVSMKLSWWLPTTNPDLLLYYELRGKDSMSRESKDNVINALLATGKFEDEVYEYEMAYPL